MSKKQLLVRVGAGKEFEVSKQLEEGAQDEGPFMSVVESAQ